MRNFVVDSYELSIQGKTKFHNFSSSSIFACFLLTNNNNKKKTSEVWVQLKKVDILFWGLNLFSCRLPSVGAASLCQVSALAAWKMSRCWRPSWGPIPAATSCMWWTPGLRWGLFLLEEVWKYNFCGMIVCVQVGFIFLTGFCQLDVLTTKACKTSWICAYEPCSVSSNRHLCSRISPIFKKYALKCLPQLNAIANRAAGKGYENEDNYSNIKFQFIGIENIHVMRNSQQKMLEGS